MLLKCGVKNHTTSYLEWVIRHADSYLWSNSLHMKGVRSAAKAELNRRALITAN